MRYIGTERSMIRNPLLSNSVCQFPLFINVVWWITMQYIIWDYNRLCNMKLYNTLLVEYCHENKHIQHSLSYSVTLYKLYFIVSLCIRHPILVSSRLACVSLTIFQNSFYYSIVMRWNLWRLLLFFKIFFNV